MITVLRYTSALTDLVFQRVLRTNLLAYTEAPTVVQVHRRVLNSLLA